MKLYENGEIGFNIGNFQIVLKDKGVYINEKLMVFYSVQILKDGEYVAGAVWTKEDFTIKKIEDYIEETIKKLRGEI
jgi:hypothetical protein